MFLLLLLMYRICSYASPLLWWLARWHLHSCRHMQQTVEAVLPREVTVEEAYSAYSNEFPMTRPSCYLRASNLDLCTSPSHSFPFGTRITSRTFSYIATTWPFLESEDAALCGWHSAFRIWEPFLAACIAARYGPSCYWTPSRSWIGLACMYGTTYKYEAEPWSVGRYVFMIRVLKQQNNTTA